MSRGGRTSPTSICVAWRKPSGEAGSGGTPLPQAKILGGKRECKGAGKGIRHRGCGGGQAAKHKAVKSCLPLLPKKQPPKPTLKGHKWPFRVGFGGCFLGWRGAQPCCCTQTVKQLIDKPCSTGVGGDLSLPWGI